MPSNLVKTKSDEKEWSKAKRLAKKANKVKNKWAYTTAIYKKLKKYEQISIDKYNSVYLIENEKYHKIKKNNELLKNPTLKEIINLIKQIPSTDLKMGRAILYSENMYFWVDPSVLHHVIIEEEHLPKTSITLEMDFSESPIEIRLSVTNKKLNNIYKLDKEKQVKIIMEHPIIEKLFGSYDFDTNKTTNSGMYTATYK